LLRVAAPIRHLRAPRGNRGLLVQQLVLLLVRVLRVSQGVPRREGRERAMAGHPGSSERSGGGQRRLLVPVLLIVRVGWLLVGGLGCTVHETTRCTGMGLRRGNWQGRGQQLGREQRICCRIRCWCSSCCGSRWLLLCRQGQRVCSQPWGRAASASVFAQLPATASASVFAQLPATVRRAVLSLGCQAVGARLGDSCGSVDAGGVPRRDAGRRCC
jgi:hypothetical protein